MATSPVAFLSIKTQFDNLGDALINRELCRLAADRVETFVDFSRAPLEFQRSMQIEDQVNVTILRKFGFARLLGKMISCRLAGHACYFFLNPGGLGGKKMPLKNLASACVYNLLLGILRMIGVRICHVGVSYDTMSASARFVAKWRRNLLHSFAVRDLESSRYLQSIGMPADGIVPDLSFNLYRQPADSASTRNTIAFSFRFDDKVGDGKIEAAVRHAMDTFGADHDWLFVVQVARDEQGMRRLQAACQDTGAQNTLLICHDDIDALSKRYASCKAIYSNRLHALLLAAHAGTSPYALVARGKQPKIEGMFNDLGFSDRLVFIGEELPQFPAISPLDEQRLVCESRKLSDYFDALLTAQR